jgi:class 3 adenylate cyclase
MWSLTITNPKSEPVQIKIIPGKMSIGRLVTSDIVINDVAASRRHAEIYFDSVSEVVKINDLKSSNGTYVNRQKITGYYRLQNQDVIRIGQTIMHLVKISDSEIIQKGISGTRHFTRELVLEAVDEHPILLNEITEKLNTVDNLDSATNLIVDQIKKSMGVNICEIILAKDFNKINAEGADSLIVRAIRKSSIEVSPLSMCVPVISNDKPLALIYLEKTRQGATPFDKRDMQLVVAISHQTALTMARIALLERVRKEGQVKQHLLRFVSPIESEELLKGYLKTGVMPDLEEKKVSVMFAEIGDSTGLAERIGATKFSSVLNSFYQYALPVIFKKGGIGKMLGDGVMAFFMEAKDAPGPEERAVSAAREIIEFAKKVTPPEPEQAFVIGAAVNTAKATAGYFGSQDRAEFNVLGSLIKMTYRMQEYALPNRIFMGASTAEAIHNKYLVQKTGSLKIIGSEQPLQVYEISMTKISPFVQMENDMSAAFKAVAEKLKARKT